MAEQGDPTQTPVPRYEYESLSERQRRGVELWQRAQVQNGLVLPVTDDSTLWFSQSDTTRAYRVEREIRNRRGVLQLEYRCQCQDFVKHGAIDCKHVFAEKLRRCEVQLVSAPRKTAQKSATRRKARKRLASDGGTVRSAHRRAKRKLPVRVPELISSLKRAFDKYGHGVVIPIREQLYRGGKTAAHPSTRAATLLAKVACGLSASEMMPHFESMIEEGLLQLRRAPNENTFSDWMNDERLTPVLREFLRMTSLPFREREIGAIIDSSKVSQMMTAHQKPVEYDFHDVRPGADWMKSHALVGVDTLVVMAVEFSGVYGAGTHDLNFLEPLVEAAVSTFPLEYLLGDKAYLTEMVPEWLKGQGISAVIPIKKRWFRDGTRHYNRALTHLVEWFDQNENRDFHEVYRLRSKIECLFSVLKRTAQGYCWSRGRRRTTPNASEPCVAWINELLCKFVYVNLRTSVNLEEETGVKIDYLVPSRRFPAPDQPLLQTHAA